jgi:phenylpropionate dioxygenase-like ring-hydroxylating dioxygenase large terminal subunit
MAYLRNCWYMAAWGEELGSTPLARTFLGEPVVLFRDADGAPRALFDRCPHRFAPLSRGRLADGIVECVYHGLKFGPAGDCVANPHGRATRSLSVRSYPVVEAHRAIWIWMGDPQRADAGEIRNLAFLGQAPDTAFNSGYIHGHGAYELFVDNILDLSHTDYLHPDTLGGGSITRTKAEVVENDDGSIFVAWRSFDEVPIPLQRSRLPPGIERVDSWTEITWTAPGVISLVNGAVPAGTPRAEGGNSFNVHIFTPETETTTHYFFAATRDFCLEDAELNEQICRTRAQIFSTEDEPMIRAQQERMGTADFWSLRPVLLPIDEGAVKVRRRMDALIAAEQTAAESL